MALWKKEVLVRPNSSATFDQAMEWTRNWLKNTFQDKPENKDENGNYKDYFFADVFFAPGHPNGGQLWRIFSDACKDKYGLTPAASGRIEFKILDQPSLEDEIAQMEVVVDSHEERITALENSSNEVEATVI